MQVGKLVILAGACVFGASTAAAVVGHNDDAGWGAIVGGIMVYGGTCEYIFTRQWARRMIIGFSAHNVRNQEPIRLPWAVAAWSAASAGALAACHYVLRDPSRKQNDLVVAPNSFFSVGWRSGLMAAGIPVNHWWIYLLIVLYQLTRAIFGSLVKNLYTHHYQQCTNAPQRMDKSKRDRLLVGNALVSVFLWWSALTDVLFSASQIDLAICTLLITIAADYAQVLYKIDEANATSAAPVTEQKVHSESSRRTQLLIIN